MSERDDGRLILLYDAVSVYKNGSKMRSQWVSVARAYGQSIYLFTRYDNSGYAPWRLKAIEWNGSQSGAVGAYQVDTVNVQRYYDDDITYSEYVDAWLFTIHGATEREKKVAENIFENGTKK